MEQSQKLEDMEQLVSKLAKSKDKSSRQLQGMKRGLRFTETEAKDEKAKISSSMSQLMVELNTVKETLRETRAREKQVRTKNAIPRVTHVTHTTRHTYHASHTPPVTHTTRHTHHASHIPRATHTTRHTHTHVTLTITQ